MTTYWIRFGWRLAALGIALGLGATGLRAAAPRFAVDAHWTVDEGLPQSSVLTMVQTRDGYLWLGTLGGLARFDGTHFTVFDESTTPGLNSSRILRLFEDSNRNLWVGTETAGLVKVSPLGKVTPVAIQEGPPSFESRLSSACEDATGAVWLYTADDQLCRYQGGQASVWTNASHALQEAVMRLPVYHGERPSSRRRMIIPDGPNRVVLGTDFGLESLQVGQGTKESLLAVIPNLHFLCPSPHGGYWQLANGYIRKIRDGRVVNVPWPYPWSKPGLEVTAACEDAQGNLFVGTYGDGVYWFDPAGQTNHLEGLSHPSVLSMLIDSQGCLWVGTDGGLNRVKPQAFQVLEGTRSLNVQSVCSDGQRGLWIGYNGERVDHWTGEELVRFSLPKAAGGADMAVRAVLRDREGRVWAGVTAATGAQNGGLYQWQDGGFQRVAADLVPPQVNSLFQDQHDLLFVGTESLLARWDEVAGWQRQSASVRTLARDRADRLWLGSKTGLVCLEAGQPPRYFTSTNGLPSEAVSCLCADGEGVLWVGTSKGLARLEQERWTIFTTREGLAGNNIAYLLEDDSGGLWIGSNAGLMRARKKDLNEFARGQRLPGAPGQVPIRVYGKLDGLPTRECTQGSQPAACRTADGRLWFPTVKGLAFVDPAELQPSTNAPPVAIEAVLVDGVRQNSPDLRSPPPTRVTVPAGKEGLEILYTGLNLSAPDKGRFRYRLQGYETSWREVDAGTRRANYSKLPPDRYRFQLRAGNEDGFWNEAGVELAVEVLPPFYRTWWFLTLTSGLLLGLVVGSVHYVSTQRLQRQLATLRQQEALEKERARIARDIHDQVGANLTQVSLLGEMIETDKDLPNEVEAHARLISQTALETTRALDEIVWTVNPSNDTLDELINYICKYAQEYLALAGLKYRLEVPPDLPRTPIAPELRHNAFLAAKEAVNNVVKHAHATAAWVQLQLEPGRFTLEIQDDGRGLPPEAHNKGRNGLRNMRKRMEDVGGSFTVMPRPGGGTVVCLSAPLDGGAPRG